MRALGLAYFLSCLCLQSVQILSRRGCGAGFRMSERPSAGTEMSRRPRKEFGAAHQLRGHCVLLEASGSASDIGEVSRPPGNSLCVCDAGIPGGRWGAGRRPCGAAGPLCSLPSLFCAAHTSSRVWGIRAGRGDPHPVILTQLNPQGPAAVWKEPELGLIPAHTPPLSPGAPATPFAPINEPGSAGSLLGSWRNLALKRGEPISPHNGLCPGPSPAE